jgi:hypothetical protein
VEENLISFSSELKLAENVCDFREYPEFCVWTSPIDSKKIEVMLYQALQM